MPQFDQAIVEEVPREMNARAYIRSKLASTKSPGNNRSVVKANLPQPSIEEVVMLIELDNGPACRIRDALYWTTSTLTSSRTIMEN